MTGFDFHKDLLQVIVQLNAAITNTGFYSPSHPQVGKFLDAAYEGLTHLLELKPEVTIFLIGDDVVADNRNLPSDSPHVAKIVSVLKKRAIERMTFTSGLPKEELQQLIQDLASADTASVRSSSHIKLGKVEIRGDASEALGEAVGAEEELQAERELLTLVKAVGLELDDVRRLYLKVKQYNKCNPLTVKDVVEEFIRNFRKDISLMHELARLKSSQESSFIHAVNVGMLTVAQAESMGFTGEHLHQIGIAALLHDIGRLFLPDEILNRFGEHLDRISVAFMLRDVGKLFIVDGIVNQLRKLTKREYGVIQGHTIKGSLHLLGLDGIPRLAALAALEHHVKYDGTGYPAMNRGWKPNLVSQMITISDVFDAMPANDSDKKSKPVDKIAWVLNRGKGSSFEPQLVDHFLTLIGK